MVCVALCCVAWWDAGAGAEPPTRSEAAGDVGEPAELLLTDLFVRPVGPRALEYTERTKSLDGRKVRVRGYMVLRSSLVAGYFMLAHTPLIQHDAEMGPCDDLPPGTLFVTIQGMESRVLPHEGGLVEVVGTLRLGTREESDGRISSVRLELDELRAVAPTPAGDDSPPVPGRAAR
jgi:hypothetical protein